MEGKATGLPVKICPPLYVGISMYVGSISWVKL